LHFPAVGELQSKPSSADQTSAAQYPQGQDPRNANFSSSATPTSDYGIAPSSARSGSFPDYIQRSQYPPTGQGASAGGMAQATSPSLPLHNDQAISHNGNANKSDPDVPIDPSIAAASPTYPQHHPYSPYTPGEAQPMYGQHPAHFPRPDWPPGHYQTPPHMPSPYGQPVTTGPPTPAMVSPVQRPPTVRDTAPNDVRSLLTARQGGHPLSTVYSFVPIPGAQQHKRPRRRYEEIERMYKCGWNGCEKAYGTLNHLNAHVTMQSHGSKRTPEGEFDPGFLFRFAPKFPFSDSIGLLIPRAIFSNGRSRPCG
jgi:transcription factor CON7